MFFLFASLLYFMAESGFQPLNLLPNTPCQKSSEKTTQNKYECDFQTSKHETETPIKSMNHFFGQICL